MKKLCGILVIILLVLVIVGCSSNSNKELCESIDAIEVSDYTESENYNELESILQKDYNEYCKKDSKVCSTLKNYINSTKARVNIEDCSNKEENWRKVCELNNQVKVLDKKNKVNYMHEEVWAVCNAK